MTLIFKYFYPYLSVKFVTDGHTVGPKWLTGCGDLASWILFTRVSILKTSGWVFVPMIKHFVSFTMLGGTCCVDGQTLRDGK